jgi:8-oxo-dGTP diphosphatase
VTRGRTLAAMADKPQAVVAVIVRHGRFLVVQRGPEASRSGYWAPPSGRVEPGETQPRALVREMREELGLTVRPLAKVWECDTDDGTFRLHWWAVEPGPETLSPDPGEVSEARWVNPAEFAELHPTFADDRHFLTRVFPRSGLA